MIDNMSRARFLYGVSDEQFKSLKWMGHLPAYQLKIAWCDELLKSMNDEPIEMRDLFRISEVVKAREWNRDRILELM